MEHAIKEFRTLESLAHALPGTVSPLLVEVAFVSRRRNYRSRYTQVATLQAPVDLEFFWQRPDDPPKVVEGHCLIAVPEAVKANETSFDQTFCMSASSGSLIHATVGRLGGVGRPANREGLAA